MEANELRRSTLERKDRDELVTIATALGTKPPSRARKAEIVDLIITTATTGSGDDSSSDNGASDNAMSEASGSEEAMNGAPDNDAEADDASVTTYHAGDDEFDFGEVTTKTKGSGRGRQKAENAKKSAKGDANGGSESNTPNKASGDDGDGGADRGNRRRRRRGRGGDQNDADTGPVNVEGYLDLRDDGYGFLRVGSSRSSMDDAYVSVKQVRQFGLRKGDHLAGTSRPANRNEKNPAMLTIDSINGGDTAGASDRRVFDDLTPSHPTERLALEGEASGAATRIMDLLAPIGKGQRSLIVAPPRSGKTTLLGEIAAAIETNHPDMFVLILTIDERPEDITDITRSVKEAEVIASAFDRPADEHVALVDMTLERAKRLVELGRDVVLLFDGVTRLVRAHSQTGPTSGHTMPGGIDSGSIYPAKRLLGAARAMEEGGSLTVIATASFGEASGDDSILSALTGLANMELRLHAGAVQLGTFPAIDVENSHTRNADNLMDEQSYASSIALRSALGGVDDPVGDGLPQLEKLLEHINGSKNNEGLLKVVAKGV